MQTCLTRSEYTAAVREAFAGLQAVIDVEMPEQYPKNRVEGQRELHFRGVYVGPDFADREWMPDELDRVVEALELAGQLTAEAQQAKAAGVSLDQWRLDHVDAT